MNEERRRRDNVIINTTRIKGIEECEMKENGGVNEDGMRQEHVTLKQRQETRRGRSAVNIVKGAR